MFKFDKKDNWFFNLIRHQITGITATGVDFSIFNLFYLVFNVWYITANIVGAFCGAIVGFIISNKWAFSGSKNSFFNQAVKYLFVSVGSLLLNTFLVYLLTETVGLAPNYSKVIAAVVVATTYNFLLLRYFVFKK